jgi:hypothetical protein
MEYNTMRELNVNEIEQVNGGIYQWFAGWAAGEALSWSIRQSWGTSTWSEMSVAP